MRLCYLADGGSVHTRRWLRHFAEQGHEVHLISLEPSGVPGVQEHRLARRFGNKLDYLAAIPRVRRLVKSIRPDLLHAHYATSYGFLGALSGLRPFVLTAWGSDILVTPRESALMRHVVGWVLERADAITSDAEFMTDAILEMGGRGKTLTIPLGVSKGLLDAPVDAPRRPVVVSLRNLEPQFRIDRLIQAFQTVASRDPSARLLIGNRGPELPALQALAKSLNLVDRVEFIGFQSLADLHRLLSESAVYVSIPESDATSVTLLEAMALGAYPVVSDLPANREWVDDGKNGAVIAHGAIDALADAILRALGHPEVRENAARLNRAIIERKAVWESNMADVEAMYREQVARYRRDSSVEGG
jgi:glycosyltransferase involved in cell wall biosynthesis